MASEGRPEIWEDHVPKLEEGFSNGLNILEACLYAGIGRTTFYRHAPEGSDIRNRFEELSNHLRMVAKNNVAAKIKEADMDTTKWWLERKVKDEFSTRTEQTGADGKDLNPGDFTLKVTKVGEIIP